MITNKLKWITWKLIVQSKCCLHEKSSNTETPFKQYLEINRRESFRKALVSHFIGCGAVMSPPFFCLRLISDFLHLTHTFLQVLTFDFVALCPFRAGAMPRKANRKIFLNFIFILDFSRQPLYKYKQRATVTRHTYEKAPIRPSSPPKKTSWRKANIHSKRDCPKLSCGDIKLRLPLG